MSFMNEYIFCIFMTIWHLFMIRYSRFMRMYILIEMIFDINYGIFMFYFFLCKADCCGITPS